MTTSSNSSPKRAHVFIKGHVQGVGFRYFTKTNAQKIGLTGWVKNRTDGRVEAIFEGTKEDVLTMIERCKKGPRASRVEDIELQWKEFETPHSAFKIKRT